MSLRIFYIHKPVERGRYSDSATSVTNRGSNPGKDKRNFFVNNQLDVQFYSLYLFIPILYMFRVTMCTSSGESIVSIRPLIYVTYIQ